MSHQGPPADEISLSQELNMALGPDRSTDDWKRILDMRDVLMENRLAGNGVEKKKIPKYYLNTYGVTNLYRYEFSGGYRACYTLQKLENGTGICAVILELMDHPAYEKRFGYSS